MDTNCFYCSRPAPEGGLFCCRCGGSLAPDPPHVAFRSRIDKIRHMLRNRAWEGVSGPQIIAGQIRLAQEQLQSHPGSDEGSAESLLALIRELLSVDSPPNLVRWIPVASNCLELFQPSQALEVRDRVAALRGFADRLTAEEKRLSRSTSTADAVKAWLASVATQCTVGEEEARSHVLTAPHVWPRIASSLDPTIRDRAKAQYLAAEGIKLLRTNDPASALSKFRTALQFDASSLRALEGMAAAHVRLRQVSESMPYHLKAVALGTRDAPTCNNYAWFSCTEATDSARDLLRCRSAALQAVELAPIAGYWDTLAEVLLQQGDVRAAFAATREAIRDRPDRPAYRERMEALCGLLQTHDVFSDVAECGVALDEFSLRNSDMLSGLDFDPDDSMAEAEESNPAPEEDAAASACGGDESVELGADIDDGDDNLTCPAPPPAPPKSRVWDSIIGPFRSTAAHTDVQAEASAQPQASPLPPPPPIRPTSRLANAIGTDATAHAIPEPPPGLITDDVQFSVTAPSIMGVGTYCLVEVWAHHARQRDHVLELAREAQGGADLRVKSKLGVQIARGSQLAVHLNIRGLEVPDPEENISWDGDIVNASFPVEVPADAKAGSYPATVVVRSGHLSLAKIHFLVTVGLEAVPTPQTPAAAKPYSSAFASYASRDRDQVLARIQGIQKVLPSLDVFLDVASMHSGQNWQERLAGEIMRRDVFFLFWSEAASTSPWVEREWRMALQHKGIQAIDPIPLVSPEVIAPPPELAGDLHFNDWVLAYMRAAI